MSDIEDINEFESFLDDSNDSISASSNFKVLSLSGVYSLMIEEVVKVQEVFKLPESSSKSFLEQSKWDLEKAIDVICSQNVKQQQDETASSAASDPIVFSDGNIILRRNHMADINEFVAKNPLIKFCPRRCNSAIIVEVLIQSAVTCSCGFSFCFNCEQENHDPVSCQDLREWKISNKSSEFFRFERINERLKKIPPNYESKQSYIQIAIDVCNLCYRTMSINFAFMQLYRPIDGTHLKLMDDLREQFSNAAHTLHSLLYESNYQDDMGYKSATIISKTDFVRQLREKVMELGLESIDNGWWVKNGTGGEPQVSNSIDEEMIASLLYEDLFMSDFKV